MQREGMYRPASSDGPRFRIGGNTTRPSRRRFASLLTASVLVAGLLTPVLAQPVAQAATGQTVDLRVLLIGGAGGAAADPPTAAWAAGLTSQGVAFKEVDATGGIPAETVALPALTSSTTHGLFNAVVFAGKPADFAAGQLSALYAYESAFGIRQVDGNFVPGYPSGTTVGLNAVTDAQTGAGISGTTASLTAAGLTTFAALNGPVPIDVGVFGSPGTPGSLPAGATETPLLDDAAGNALIGVYQHPPTGDAQANVQEMTIGFNYNREPVAVVDARSGTDRLGDRRRAPRSVSQLRDASRRRYVHFRQHVEHRDSRE